MSMLEFHNVANLFPMMTESERVGLQKDIIENGLLTPIYLYKGKIIDGRNRYLACLEVGYKPIFKEYDGPEENLIQFVLSLNLHRRHLNSGQKSCLAVEVLPMLEQQNLSNKKQKISASRKGEAVTSARGKKSTELAGELFAVSARYVANAKKLKETAPELFEEVKTGTTTLSKALATMNEMSAKLHSTEIVENIQITDNKQDTEIIENNEIGEISANLHSTTALTKSDLKKIDELVSFGMTKSKAEEYILSKKKTVRTKSEKIQTVRKIEFRVEESEKNTLVELAKKRGISLSELLRELVRNVQ